MSWDEFTTLLSGLNSDTPLGNVIAIRKENDSEILKRFTPEQRQMRNEWRIKQANSMSDDYFNEQMTGLNNLFRKMSGKEVQNG